MNQNAFDQNIKERIAKLKQIMQNLFKASIQINKYKSISHRFKSQIEEFNSKLWKISNTKARIAIQGDIKQITYQTAFFDNVHAKDLEIKFNLLAILMSDHMTKESCNFQKLQIQVDYLIFSVLLNLNSFNQLIQKEKIYQDSLYAQMAPLDEESQNKVLFQIQEIIQILFYWEKEVSSQLTKKSQFISNVIEDSKSPNLEKEESVIKLEIFNYDNENLYQKSQENAKPNFKLVNSPFKTLLQFIRDRIVSLGLCLVHFGNVNHLLFLFQEMLFSADSNNWAKQLIRFPNDSNLKNLKLFTDTLAMVYRILENEDENKKSLEYNIQFNLIEFLNSLPLSKFTDFLDSNPFQDFVQFQNYVLKICKNFGNILQKLDPTIYELKIITQKFIDFSREISTSIFESNKFDISQKQELIDNIFLEINKSISQVPHLVCFLTPLPYHLVSLNSSWEIVNFLLRIVETTPNQKLNQLNENSNQINENSNENSNQINENSNQLNQNSNENSNQLNENLNEKINQNSNEKINQNSNQINENSNQLNEKINQNSNQNSNEKINQNSNEKFLFNCSYDIGSPIIYLFGKIAKFQKNEQLSTFVLFFFWQIATSEHKQNQIYLKTILETTREILQYQPQNSGFILGQINNSAPNILSPEIIHSFMSTIPIELWSPLKKHFGIIKKWIEHPFETPQFAAVTQIIEKLNWGYSSDSLYINPKFHQMILFAISNRCIQLKKKEITNHPHFYQWCWKIVFQLKLFANNGQRYLEPLDFFQFQNKITKKMSSLTSYTILVSTNFIDVLETHLKERAKNSKNDFETLCNRLFQSFIKEKTTFQLFKALYLLIKNSLYKISLQKLDEEQNSFEYCLKLVDNVQFLYRDYFQKTISLEIVPTEYTEIPFFPAELFISDFIYTMLDSSIEPNSQPKENQPITNQNTYAINCSTEFNKIILFWLSLFTSFQDWSRNPIIVHCLNKLARISFVFDCYQLIEMFFIQKLKDHSLNNTPQNPFGIIGCYPFFVRKNWNQKDRLKLIHNSPYILFTILMAETKHELQNRKIIGKQILEKKPKEIAKFIKSKLIYPHLNHVFWWVDFLRFHKYNHPLSSLIWQVFFALYFEMIALWIANQMKISAYLPDQRRKLASKNGLFGLELLILYPDTKHNLFDELTFRLDELSKNLKSDFGMLFSSMKYWIQKDVQTLFSQAHTKNKEMHDQYFFSKLISFVTTELFDKKSNHLWFDLFHKPTFVDHSSLKTEYRKIFASFFGDEKNADKTTSSNTDKHTPHSLRNHHKDGLDSFSKSSESILDNSENGNGNVAKNEPNEIPNYDQKYILSWFKTVFDKIIKFETNFEIIDDINDDFNKYFDLLVSKSTSFQDKLKYHKKMDIFFFNFISKIFTNEQEKHIFTFTFPDILEIREESLLFVFPTFKKNAQMIEALNKNRSLASKHLAKYPLISKEVPFSIFFLEKAFEILSRFLETCQQQEQKRKIQFIHIKWTNRIMFQLCNGYSILFPPIYNFAINNFENVILVFLNLYSEFCLSGKYELIQNENKYQISSSEMDLTLHLVFKLIFSRFPKKPYPKKLAELIHLQNVLKNYLQAQFPNFYVNLLRFALKNFLEDEKGAFKYLGISVSTSNYIEIVFG
ncbi:hypothetical protein M0811_11838 [Anaeramoeba ignava]|uniref:Uncharacterized protein n=1 Tax=Anaeramoeba ignava TaxID=1746090 RepID=A0A9Q0LB53_ANAIG|nr:hypothetical protein M0811_11838 [Anaeramoeba ignava]